MSWTARRGEPPRLRVASLLARVTVPPFLRAALLVHGAAVGLLVLVVSVEQANARSAQPLGREVMMLWARLAPVLSVLASALGWARMHKALLALGTLGCGEGRVRWGSLLPGLLAGVIALAVPAQGTPSAWIRGEGGWFHLGRAIPDVVGGVVGVLPGSWAWPVAGACVLGAALGARTWRAGALATVVVGSLLGDGLVDSGGLGVMGIAWAACVLSHR